MRGKGRALMTPKEGKMAGPQASGTVSTKQARIAHIARKYEGTALRTLAHHMDIAWLHEAYKRTRKDGAVGIDKVSGADYAQDLTEHLERLLEEAKSGLYRAPAVRRAFIDKEGGKKRPLGIPTFEDKVLQRAVVMLLQPVYEQDFYDFSYGFRPGRSAHQALERLDEHLYEHSGGWVLEVDIHNFFTELDHKKLRELLSKRVVDGVVRRLIGKWLRAGVLQDGVISRLEKGSPQGAVISPLLANIYLHEVLDRWWVEQVQPRLEGRSLLVRYADDFVMVFSHRADALKVEQVLHKRFARFGLTLHPEKTALVDFKRPRPQEPERSPESFDFLGFCFYWGTSRKGHPIPKQKTSKRRLARALKRLNQWLKRARTLPVRWQARLLRRKLTGHYLYYGRRHNIRDLRRFYKGAIRLWKKWLSRRSQRAPMDWKSFNKLLRRHPLPTPRLATDPARQRRLAFA
jgi:group II intron reverse transcriptase/maturase